MPKPLNDYLTLLKIINNKEPRHKLIEELNKDFPLIINSSHDLYSLFLALRPDERSKLGNDFQDRLLSLISSLGTLYFFSYLLNEELKETIFQRLIDQRKILRPTSKDDYLIQLRSAPEAYRKTLIEQIKKDFSRLIQSTEDLENFLMAMQADERNEFCNDIIDRLPTLISSFRQLTTLSSLFSDKVNEKLFSLLKNQGKIPEPSSLDDYIAQLESAPEAYYKILIGRIKKDFSQLINTPVHLYNFLIFLTLEEIQELCNEFEEQLPNILSDFEDLVQVSSLLPEKQKSQLFHQLKIQGKIPQTACLEDYINQLKVAPEVERKKLIEEIKQAFSQLVKSTADLHRILSALVPLERTAFCNGLDDQVTALISNLQSLALFSSLLPEKLKATLFDLLYKEPSETNAPSGILVGSETLDQKGISLPLSIGTPLFFQPAVAKKIRPILNNPESNLSLEQLTRIQEQIDQLNSEINSCWPYPNIWRKELKVMALEALIEYASTQSVGDAVQQIKLDFPNVTKGYFSTRTADLLADLERETSLVSSI